MASNNNLHPSPSSSPPSRGRPKQQTAQGMAAKPGGTSRNTIDLSCAKGERMGPLVAHKLMGPENRHGALMSAVMDNHLAKSTNDMDRPTLLDISKELRDRQDASINGDLVVASELLTAQALTLDLLFVELAGRSRGNIAINFDASCRFMQLALKAQASSRATVEALARLHQPREQIIKHVHVGSGGQAVVAEEFHHHPAGGSKNDRADQSLAPDAPTASGAALPSPDTEGHAVPEPSRKRKAKVPHARRD